MLAATLLAAVLWALTGQLDMRANGKHADGKGIISDGSDQVEVTLTGTRKEEGHLDQTFKIVRTVKRNRQKLLFNLDGTPQIGELTWLQKVCS